jgi:Na+/glutamate symporter
VGDLSDTVVRAAAALTAKVEIASRDAKKFFWIGSAAFGMVFSILIGRALGNLLASRTVPEDGPLYSVSLGGPLC